MLGIKNKCGCECDCKDDGRRHHGHRKDDHDGRGHKDRRKRERRRRRKAMKQLATTPFVYRDQEPNNVEHPEWGRPNYPLLRAAPPQYADGISAPAGADRPNARYISNEILKEDGPRPNKRNASALFWLWGQFLDHDLGLTEAAKPAEPFNIAVPAGDPVFDPEGTGTQVLPMNRSVWDPSTGTGVDNPRQQINQITPYIDAGVVYGDDEYRLRWMRTGYNGLMKESMGDMLPYNDGKMHNAPNKSMAFQVAGDIRCNEHLGLQSMHTLFMREHNYWARKLKKSVKKLKLPALSDEELFQRARVMVEAEVQAITVNEFLPLLLGGKEVFGPYTGYDPTVNPQVRNEFTTAAYRLGHTLVSDPFPRLNEDGTPLENVDHLTLKQAYFVPWRLANEGGIEPVLRGLATVEAQEFDGHIIDALRDFLFGKASDPPGQGPHGIGLDLTAFNIQRGRDHGLADYNTTRQYYGLPRVVSFSDVISDPERAAKMTEVYGSPDNADLYVALQVEDHYKGVPPDSTSGKPIDSMLGVTTMAILGEQAGRIRAGDRFWYQIRLPEALQEVVDASTLSEIIKRNTSIEWMQKEAMVAHPRHRPQCARK